MPQSRADELPGRFTLALALVSLLAGCATSPASSVGRRAIDAAMNGRLDAFRRELGPGSQSALGTPATMAAIRGRLAAYTNVSVGDAVMTSAQTGDQGEGHFGDVRRTYEAAVSGAIAKGAPVTLIYTLQLQCALSYRAQRGESAESCPTMIERTDVPWSNCTPGAPVDDSIALRESCVVTAITAPPSRN